MGRPPPLERAASARGVGVCRSASGITGGATSIERGRHGWRELERQEESGMDEDPTHLVAIYALLTVSYQLVVSVHMQGKCQYDMPKA